MSDKLIFNLINAEVRKHAAEHVYEVGEGYVCEIRKRRRIESQNAKFHAMLGDICAQWTFNGRRLRPMEAKVLFISAHACATGEGSDIVEGLEGELVNLRESSAEMTISRMGSLIEYVSAWGANNRIRFSAGQQYAEPANWREKAGKNSPFD